MAKQAKRTKKFVKNKLDRTIKDRKEWKRKSAQVKRSKQKKQATGGKRAGRGEERGGQSEEDEEDDDDDDDDEQKEVNGSNGKRMTVDEFMGGGFKAGLDVDGEEDDDDDDDGEDEEDGEDSDDASLRDIDELSGDDDEEAHAQDLAKLAERDPEFYRYLQENDNDLLEFGGEADDDEEDDDGEELSLNEKGKAKSNATVVVTPEVLRGWQKSMLQTHSLRAFRRLLLAFRAAAHMGASTEENVQDMAYAINDATTFNKLILTALKYVPVVLSHHIGFKQTPSGKFKVPTNNKKFGALQRSVQSYFASLHKLLHTLPEPKLLYTCADESVKMIPYLLPNRRLAREYVKIMLELWSTSEENVRIAAFLAVRRMASAGDEGVLEMCLRGAYRGLVRNAKSTSIFTMANINLMKHSASELFTINEEASYQQAFGFIRQLAIHLRACLKTKTQEAYQAVYNWQYVHCLDFWATVLATTCDKEKDEESALQPLVYPLVQAATGAVRMIPTSRYFPMRLHVVHSLLRLTQRTGTYIPLAPLLLEIFEAPEFTRKTKPSTLTVPSLDTFVRIPKTYVRTKVYAEALVDETSYFLLEFLHTQARSIAFPELVIPVVASLRRTIKVMKALRDSQQAKMIAVLRNLVEKIDRHAEFVRARRSNVDFAPRDRAHVASFLQDVSSELPIEAAVRLSRKVRADKKQVLQRTHINVDEDEDEDDDQDDEVASDDDDVSMLSDDE